MSASKKLNVVVEGNIGAGKSVFLKMLEAHLEIDIIPEPCQQWQNVNGENILDYFYKDTRRWAYTFQTFAFVTRVVEQEKQNAQNTRQVQILERSVYSDWHCFAKTQFELGNINELEWNLYKQWFTWLVEEYTHKPSAFIYLYTEPKVCFDRMKKRSRFEESDISLQYLEILHEKHENWLRKKEGVIDFVSDVPVLILECNQDFQNNYEMQEMHVHKICNFLEENFDISLLRKGLKGALAKPDRLGVR